MKSKSFCEAIKCSIRDEFFLDMDNYTCKARVRVPKRDWYCRYLNHEGRIRKIGTFQMGLDARSEIQILAALVKSKNNIGGEHVNKNMGSV